MTNIVPLSNIEHADLRIVPTRGAQWGDAVNRVPLFPPEFEAAQREFPILFGRDEAGALQAFALLGLDRDENLFLDGDRWTARYLPALLARGPFSIGLQRRDDGEAEPMMHVDLDHPRVSRNGGEPLFLPHGGNAPYLEHIAEVLRTIHAGHAAQAPMFVAFAEAGLIEPVKLEFMLDETLRYDLVDFCTIGAERLARLGGPALERLHRQGVLAAAFHVVSSLGNVRRLIDLKNFRRSAL